MWLTLFSLQSPHISMGKSAVLIGEIEQDGGHHISVLVYTIFLRLSFNIHCQLFYFTTSMIQVQFSHQVFGSMETCFIIVTGLPWRLPS